MMDTCGQEQSIEPLAKLCRNAKPVSKIVCEAQKRAGTLSYRFGFFSTGVMADASDG